ncbi:MAG: hypothetical protein CSA42_01035 [Gammaproteobacteria bacterium]|nr:MAG: hypothetical protein CSA42_01035 [Gammaproteobacteria bacterium]
MLSVVAELHYGVFADFLLGQIAESVVSIAFVFKDVELIVFKCMATRRDEIMRGVEVKTILLASEYSAPVNRIDNLWCYDVYRLTKSVHLRGHIDNFC